MVGVAFKDLFRLIDRLEDEEFVELKKLAKDIIEQYKEIERKAKKRARATLKEKDRLRED